jgi:hypothetical protein
VTLAAGTYNLSFYAAQRANVPQTGQTFEVLVDGQLQAYTPQGTNYTGFTTPTFTVTAGRHTIKFVGLNPNGGDNTAFIDQVSITPTA